jgi:hypothetical protein
MFKTKLDLFKRKKVEIRANGIIYRGILLEATEDEITLKGNSGYVTVPMANVTSVTDPSAPLAKGEQKFVDPSFFNADDPEKKEP